MTARKCWVLAATTALALAGAAAVAPAANAAKVKPPAAVSKARVGAASSTTVLVTWKNPKSRNFRSTVVRVSAGTKAPATAKSGRAVATVAKRKHAVSVARLAPGKVYTVGLFASDGKKHYAKRVAVRIQTAPAAVSRLKATSTSSAITLTYRFSASRTAKAVVVRYAEGATAPRYPSSGTGVPATRSGATVSGLFEQTRYSFSVWARDAANRYSPVAHISAGTKGGPAGNTGAISGTVHGGDVKTKVGDAQVFAFSASDDADGYGATTAADGTYRLSELPAGQYQLCFASDATPSTAVAGYSTGCLSKLITVVGGRGTGGHDYTLARAAGFTGKVVGTAPNDPVQGVGVFGISDEDEGDFTRSADQGDASRADGTFTVTGLPAGTTQLCFGAGDAQGASVTGYLDNCEVSVVGRAGRIVAIPDVVLQPAAAVAGNVSGSVAGSTQVLAGVAVVLIEAGTGDEDEKYGSLRYSYTGNDGNYVVPGLTPGLTYNVCYDASGVDAFDTGVRDGFVTACETATGLKPWNGDIADLPAGATTVTATGSDSPMPHDPVVLAAGGAVIGQVHGDRTESVQAVIYVFDSAGNVVSGDRVGGGDTTFRAPGLPAGKFKVCVAAEDSRYASECYDNKPWPVDDDGDPGALPTGLTRVSVPAGEPAMPIDIVLTRD